MLLDTITQSLSLTPTDDTPDVTDLPCDLIRLAGEPYMQRYFIIGGPRANGESARYHHILKSDGQHLHDHPWDFLSVILRGTYLETTEHGEREHGRGSVLIRKAEDLHRLTLPTGPVWTLVVVGVARRTWGFDTPDGWIHWSEYQSTDNAQRW